MDWAEDETSGSRELRGEAGPALEPDRAAQLFAGDCGELPLETRRALAQLLAGPSLDGRRHTKLWSALVRDEAIIRRRLSELFLELVIAPDQQVAFIRQAEIGELDAPKLLRSAPLTFIDSVLLLYLRQRLAQADAHGDRAVVGIDEMVDHLAVYERALNTDRAGFNRRCQNSIEKIKKHSILQKIRSSDDRYEISPTLKLMFSAEQIRELTRVYEGVASGDGGTESPAQEDDEA